MARYGIAGLIVEMELSGRTLQQAEPYRVDGDAPAHITIRLDHEKLMQANPELTDKDIAEYMGTGAIFSGALLRYDGFQLHSSAVELEGKAYLFSAPSGTGKSTHTEKWCRLFGGKILNDDKPVLRRTEKGWMVYGTPWSGKHDLSRPVGVPLGGIAYLERGENAIRKMSATEAIPLIFSQCPRLLSKEAMAMELALLGKLLTEETIWRLTCRNNDEAAMVSWEAMTGGK